MALMPPMTDPIYRASLEQIFPQRSSKPSSVPFPMTGTVRPRGEFCQPLQLPSGRSLKFRRPGGLSRSVSLDFGPTSSTAPRPVGMLLAQRMRFCQSDPYARKTATTSAYWKLCSLAPAHTPSPSLSLSTIRRFRLMNPHSSLGVSPAHSQRSRQGSIDSLSRRRMYPLCDPSWMEPPSSPNYWLYALWQSTSMDAQTILLILS